MIFADLMFDSVTLEAVTFDSITFVTLTVIIAGLDPAILCASAEEDARVEPGHDE